jgi:DNA-binding CsgD family transcriptional regulator
MDPDFKSYIPDPALQHRDQALINLERKVHDLVALGRPAAGIARALKVPESVVEAIIKRNAPSPVRIRRGS